LNGIVIATLDHRRISVSVPVPERTISLKSEITSRFEALQPLPLAHGRRALDLPPGIGEGGRFCGIYPGVTGLRGSAGGGNSHPAFTKPFVTIDGFLRLPQLASGAKGQFLEMETSCFRSKRQGLFAK
jgi:hypothetical protein